MANTTNGASAMTEALRVRSGVYSDMFKHSHPKGIMRAMVVMDAFGADFEIDDPTLDNATEYSATQKIYVVGLMAAPTAACDLTFKSQVGSGTAETLAFFSLAAKGLLFYPVRRGIIMETAVSGGLQVRASSAIELTVYYAFATECNL